MNSKSWPLRHFNMGAMENKSLNIFNSKAVLLPMRVTATDANSSAHER